MTATVQLFDNDSDLAIVNAARVSFNKQHATFDETTDKNLLEYLAREGHFTPYAHPHLSFRITAPIFVARQLAKHTVGLIWSEVSRRYITDQPTYWRPTQWRTASETKKQGSSWNAPYSSQIVADEILRALYCATTSAYTELLNLGICPEQARAVLPQGTETTWIWTGSLAAWFRVYQLRTGVDAQPETKQIAIDIGAYCERKYPFGWAALNGPMD